MDKEIKEFFENDRFAVHSGIRLKNAEPGYAVAEMEIKDFHLNGLGIVQGGAIFTLADFAFAAASNTKDNRTVGINATISFFKAPQTKQLTAVAKELHSGNKICGYSVDVLDGNQELVARFTGSGYKRASMAPHR